MKTAINIIGAVIFSVSAMSVQAVKMHKWVDEKGQVQYGDRVPAQYLKKNRSVLNEQGVVVRKVTATKSQRILDKESENNKEQARKAKEKLIATKKIAMHDKMLLDTFTTKRDLLISRDDRVGAVDSQLQLTESNIKDQEKKLEEVKKRVTSIETSGRSVPDNLLKQVNSVSRQLETYYAYVEDKNKEREEIIKKFDKDIKRFLELKGRKAKKINNNI
jgi:hypothetical protein